mmetsp:Transcript_42345/g.109212  ORF Transcript_42345/g.109212 Transcript_42345/m.109212 type:complete len:233 (-) Transcript_42345:286-984(-)
MCAHARAAQASTVRRLCVLRVGRGCWREGKQGRESQCLERDEAPMLPIQRPLVPLARLDSSSASSGGMRVQPPSPPAFSAPPSLRFSRVVWMSFSSSSRCPRCFSWQSCEYCTMPSKDVNILVAESSHALRVSMMKSMSSALQSRHVEDSTSRHCFSWSIFPTMRFWYTTSMMMSSNSRAFVTSKATWRSVNLMSLSLLAMLTTVSSWSFLRCAAFSSGSCAFRATNSGYVP